MATYGQSRLRLITVASIPRASRVASQSHPFFISHYTSSSSKQSSSEALKRAKAFIDECERCSKLPKDDQQRQEAERKSWEEMKGLLEWVLKRS